MSEQLPILQALPNDAEMGPLDYEEASDIYKQKWKERRDLYYKQITDLARLGEQLTSTMPGGHNPYQIRAMNRAVQDYAAQARKLARLSQEAAEVIDRYVERVKKK